MEPKERIIIALDVDSTEDALQLVGQLHEHVGAFKIGFEFILMLARRVLTGGGKGGLPTFVEDSHRLMHAFNGKAFVDAKLHDIPNTVEKAMYQVGLMGVKMVNLHIQGADQMMAKALKGLQRGANEAEYTQPLLLGVTMLTSLDYTDLVKLGIYNQSHRTAEAQERAKLQFVVNLAKTAQQQGLDGVICSAKETCEIRQVCGPDFRLVTPGIRPRWAEQNDQKRITTPSDAIRNGSDYLVIGRPITQAANPVDAAKRIADEIAEAEQDMQTQRSGAYAASV
ncbi:orotidine-5'-phosphate decarboxylase [Candidatus Uhrbacteria bacterium]|nr:orotidine-5'-phosphate decarboxylase [Candidatus Uhrbacteria bacterium]MBD3284104.1 orotidine-5'-phosphate decarboxylase [Candidatus Uhrbacteria bacterium]